MLYADSGTLALWVGSMAAVVAAIPIAWGLVKGWLKVWRGFKARIIAKHDAEKQAEQDAKESIARDARLEQAADLLEKFDGKLVDQDKRWHAELNGVSTKVDTLTETVKINHTDLAQRLTLVETAVKMNGNGH